MATTREIACSFAVNPHKDVKLSGMTVSVRAGTFYSYSAPIARVAPGAGWTGPKTVLVTTAKYSQTTTRHTNQVLAQLKAEGWNIIRSDF